ENFQLSCCASNQASALHEYCLEHRVVFISVATRRNRGDLHAQLEVLFSLWWCELHDLEVIFVFGQNLIGQRLIESISFCYRTIVFSEWIVRNLAVRIRCSRESKSQLRMSRQTRCHVSMVMTLVTDEEQCF